MCSTSGSCIFFFAKPDVPVVLASRILHARLILAKSYPPFRVVSEYLGWRGEDGSSNFLPLTQCFALCVPTNPTVAHGVLGAWCESHVPDGPRFKNPKNKLLPQRGATGDSINMQEIQAFATNVPHTLTDQGSSLRISLPFVGLSRCDTILFLPLRLPFLLNFLSFDCLRLRSLFPLLLPWRTVLCGSF